MSRLPAVFADPEADPPVYPWRAAPAHLATRAQLRQRGLSPGRQGIQAILLWASRRGGRPRIQGYRFAYLFDIHQAQPRHEVTPARAAALSRAFAARRTCPRCGAQREYALSTRHGICNPCIAALGIAA